MQRLRLVHGESIAAKRSDRPSTGSGSDSSRRDTPRTNSEERFRFPAEEVWEVSCGDEPWPRPTAADGDVLPLGQAGLRAN
jgi:hypothetical protein